MVIKKGDPSVQATMTDMGRFLMSQGVIIILEPELLRDQPSIKRSLPGVRTFNEADKLDRSVDLVITIGGDGTLTWAVNLFRRGMPPVLAFAAGSLGFLTPFPLESWIRTLTSLLDLHRHRPPQPLVCRMRLRVSVRRRTRDAEHEVQQFQVAQCLNEVLVHRGAHGCLVKLNVGVDGEQVTLVQGDGLILATPTGSTAYSLAAGGSMVHPGVPGILLTPVSPHSLSFRPALLPDSAVISVGVPLNARGGAAVSVDGKDLCTLEQGDAVEVAMSQFPVPTICHTGETRDWFTSVQSGLQWNMRLEQKPM
jgi:NAD+ kinase